MNPIVRGLLLGAGALMAGGAGTFLADRHLAEQTAAIESSLRADHQARPVLVANQPLMQGDRLDAQRVALREVPVNYLHAAAITEDQWPDYAGALLRAPVEPGEPLLPSHLEHDQTTRLAELITPGDRAITLPLSGASTLNTLLNPADRVDLMITWRTEGERQTAPLLSDVPIIAIGDDLGGNDPHGGFGSASYRDITVAVSPENAARITQAQTMGEIHVALRGTDDHGPIDPFLVDARSIFSEDRADADRTPGVEVIIGGRR